MGRWSEQLAARFCYFRVGSSIPLSFPLQPDFSKYKQYSFSIPEYRTFDNGKIALLICSVSHFSLMHRSKKPYTHPGVGFFEKNCNAILTYTNLSADIIRCVFRKFGIGWIDGCGRPVIMMMECFHKEVDPDITGYTGFKDRH